jgi:beta-phosphoglucomutase-like phosphatase (HAD superfamily)
VTNAGYNCDMTAAAHEFSAPDGTGYDALIFDWDGTLVDSTQVCYVGLARALGDVGVLLNPEWYWPRQAIASPDMLVLWEGEFGPLPEPIDQIIDRCRAYVIEESPNLVVFHPNATIAQRAHSRGQPLAIGTNSADITVAAGLRETGLRELFRAVVTWSDVPPGRGKPAPDIFLMAARQLGVDPARCLVYEDSDHGVAVAHSAGMAVYNVQSKRLLHPQR